MKSIFGCQRWNALRRAVILNETHYLDSSWFDVGNSTAVLLRMRHEELKCILWAPRRHFGIEVF